MFICLPDGAMSKALVQSSSFSKKLLASYLLNCLCATQIFSGTTFSFLLGFFRTILLVVNCHMNFVLELIPRMRICSSHQLHPLDQPWSIVLVHSGVNWHPRADSRYNIRACDFRNDSSWYSRTREPHRNTSW